MLVLVAQFLQFLSWIVLLRVILSWVVQDPRNPILRIVASITDPMLRPLQSFLTFGGLDLSPMVVMIALQAISRALMAQAGG